MRWRLAALGPEGFVTVVSRRGTEPGLGRHTAWTSSRSLLFSVLLPGSGVPRDSQNPLHTLVTRHLFEG